MGDLIRAADQLEFDFGPDEDAIDAAIARERVEVGRRRRLELALGDEQLVPVFVWLEEP